MAKEKKQTDEATQTGAGQAAAMGAFTDEAPHEASPVGDTSAAADPRDARIADLERQLAEAKAAAMSQPSEPSGPPRNWKVNLQHARSRVVKATDRANAWDKYRELEGLIATEYQPEISPTDELTPEEQAELKKAG